MNIITNNSNGFSVGDFIVSHTYKKEQPDKPTLGIIIMFREDHGVHVKWLVAYPLGQLNNSIIFTDVKHLNDIIKL